jgi:hypothetical protein
MTAKIKEFPGVSLSEKDFADGKILFNYDKLNGQYAWDTGVGIGSYLASLKNGVILGSHCKLAVKSSPHERSMSGVINPWMNCTSERHRDSQYIFSLLCNLGCAKDKGP